LKGYLLAVGGLDRCDVRHQKIYWRPTQVVDPDGEDRPSVGIEFPFGGPQQNNGIWLSRYQRRIAIPQHGLLLFCGLETNRFHGGATSKE
jgi:hypothetical protein